MTDVNLPELSDLFPCAIICDLIAGEDILDNEKPINNRQILDFFPALLKRTVKIRGCFFNARQLAITDSRKRICLFHRPQPVILRAFMSIKKKKKTACDGRGTFILLFTFLLSLLFFFLNEATVKPKAKSLKH